MLLIPAIDLKDGQCVRLKQGEMDDATVFSSDPGAMARHWLASRQPYFALRSRHPCQRIHQQQHRRALVVAKPFGNRGCGLHGPDAFERRRI